jgi:hypothetical protein
MSRRIAGTSNTDKTLTPSHCCSTPTGSNLCQYLNRKEMLHTSVLIDSSDVFISLATTFMGMMISRGRHVRLCNNLQYLY